MINFLIPVVVYAAIKTGHLGVTATSLLTSLVVLFSPDTPGSTSLVLDGGIDIDVVSLMVVWTDCLIGLAVAAAYDEYYASRSFEHQAMHDHMTGLYNRTGFMDRLERALTETRRDNARHVLLHFDVDGMKVVNDRFGHHVGDLLLTGFAQELRSLIGKKDSLGRIGGDDFAILLQDCDEIPGKSSAEAICRDIENKVFDCEIERLSMTVSVGLVVVDAHGSTPEQLLMEVDTACYQAKKAGGNQVVAYGEVSRPVYV